MKGVTGLKWVNILKLKYLKTNLLDHQGKKHYNEKTYETPYLFLTIESVNLKYQKLKMKKKQVERIANKVKKT